MADQILTCWSCGTSLTGTPIPIGRREQCPKCTASLHACRQCVHYDPVASNACREPVAAEVVDKEGGNFCDFFQPRFGLAKTKDAAAEQARVKLAQAFGGTATPGSRDPASGGRDSAPGGGVGSGGIRGSTASAEDSKRRLEEMFGKTKR